MVGIFLGLEMVLAVGRVYENCVKT